MKIQTIIFSIIFTALCFTCKHKANSTTEIVDEHPENKHWSYSGETSPEHWAEIEKNSECSGAFQSPINILTHKAVLDSLGVNRLDVLYSPQTRAKSGIKQWALY